MKPAIPQHCLASLILGMWLLSGCAHVERPKPDQALEVQAIRGVLEAQELAWNSGDLVAFMHGYAAGDATRFASGGEVTLGWQTVFDRYQKRYGDRAAMGRLTFSDVDVSVTGPDSALVFGHWALQRDKDAPHGLFTLLFRRTADGWHIVHDHTSSATP
jgi:ketosteroid isomerase-like protein